MALCGYKWVKNAYTKRSLHQAKLTPKQSLHQAKLAPSEGGNSTLPNFCCESMRG